MFIYIDMFIFMHSAGPLGHRDPGGGPAEGALPRFHPGYIPVISRFVDGVGPIIPDGPAESLTGSRG